MDQALQAVLDQAFDLTDNSRLVSKGAVFFAMQGTQRHGLVGLEEAIGLGASAIVHDGLADEIDLARLKGIKIPVIERVDLAQQLPSLLRHFWKDPARSMKLHAVTGTNGKSSIAWLLAQALDGAMIGTLGVGRPGTHHPSDLTTPSIFSIYRHLAQLHHQGIEHVVIEASSHALVQGRLAGLSWETAIFTNLGHDHLDYHGDRARYGQAKAKLFRDFAAKTQLINLDDEFGEELFRAQHKALEHTDTVVAGYGLAKRDDASVWFEAAKKDSPSSADESEMGLRGTIVWADDDRTDCNSSLIGEVNAYNALVCAHVLRALGVDARGIENKLRQLKAPPGRMEKINQSPVATQVPLPKLPMPKLPMVVVDYAHSPDALKNALLMLRALCKGQLWCVFGCGGDRDPSKRAPMGRVAEATADRVVLTDDNPRHEPSLAIIRSIQSGMRQPERARVILDRSKAIEESIGLAGEHDIVLIAGKGHEKEQIVGDKRLAMDDRALSRAALDHRARDRQEAC